MSSKAVEELQVPAEVCGCDGESGNGVADVVVAVPKGSFAVLPSFAPEDRRKADEKGIVREKRGEKRRGDVVSSNLQRMLFGSIVGHESGLGE